MYKTTSSSFFLGASTPSGFHSFFDELKGTDGDYLLYVIKGGPGTGKSTIMKKIAAECDKRGLFCERIFCSSDPDSLDAVIIPSLKISVADGTAPHVIEPRYPGIREITVDLGRFRDDKKLRENKDEILRIFEENSIQHKKCRDFLSAAATVSNDTGSIALSALKPERLHKFSEKLSASRLKSHGDKKGESKKRFLSAITPKGVYMFQSTFSDLCEDSVTLSDPFGFASSVILKVLLNDCVRSGINCVMCYCPMSPIYKPEHLILPEQSLGFYTSNSWHPEEKKSSTTVDCLRFYDESILKKHKNRLSFNKRSRDELIIESKNRLESAKKIHDELEKYYAESMDFDAVCECGEKLISEIFEKC